jgi:hypothetical protein
MKNYKFVFGVLLCSSLSHGVQAVALAPVSDDGRVISVATLNGDVGLYFGNSAPWATGHVDQQWDPLGIPLAGAGNSAVTLSSALYVTENSSVALPALGSDTKLAAHKADAKDVTEPASEILLLAGLSALAIAIRRQSPS